MKGVGRGGGEGRGLETDLLGVGREGHDKTREIVVGSREGGEERDKHTL